MKKSLPKTKGISGVYLYTDKENGMEYGGQSIDILSRYNQHKDNKTPVKNSIDEAIKKKGIENFEFDWWELTGDLDKDLNTVERIIIQLRDSKNNGYNKTEGNGSKYEDYIKQFTVRGKILSLIRKDFVKSFFGKRVLLIGNFEREFIHGLREYENCNPILIENMFSKEEQTEFMKELEKKFKIMENKDFDIIISNPPYGKIGNQITKKIIDEINYKEFINILPANDYYKKCKENKLWQYVDIASMITVQNGFKNAAVTTHIARITQRPNLYLSADEFEIENFIDPQMTKFFYENSKREHYAIDASGIVTWAKERDGYIDSSKKIFIYGSRDMNHTHMPYSKEVFTYRWNHSDSMIADDFFNNSSKGNGMWSRGVIKFNTCKEKENFVNFMYSEDGFRFCSKIWKSMHVDSTNGTIGWIKVDWTKEWTVEEILKDYGYTAKEIKEVMDDLKNFKGMND